MSRKTLLGCVAAAAIVLTATAPSLALAKHTTHRTSAHSSHKSSKHTRGAKKSKTVKTTKCVTTHTRHGHHHTSCTSSVVHESRESYASGPSNGASGKVVDAGATKSAVRTYSVKKSQGLDAVARETGVSKEDIVKLNKLKAPYHLKLGQKLKVGEGSTKGEGGGKVYIVARGDTLSAVADRFHVGPKELASLNKLGRSTALKPGRRLILPEAFHDSGEIVARSLPHAADLHQTQIEPGSNATLPPVDLPSQTIAPPIDFAQVTAAGTGKFIWPLDGHVVQPFGQGPANKTDDGINIAAPVGTPVKAAASGVVIFAGKQIAAFGNYVLLQHEGGFLTAYGNMDRLNVKIGQRIDQGETIGQSGQTGQADQPELHFEVLYAAHKEDKSAPVDPQSVLPKR
jgi:murein DD-endopeptidase MepM/ murein hydrolase activator NlpD